MVVKSKPVQSEKPTIQAVPATAPEHDVRSMLPREGLLEYWYPALEDKKVKNKPIGLKIAGSSKK